MRSSLANAAWAVEDRVVWGAADVFHRLAEIVKWPFQRIAWAVEHWLIWPIQEETALWSRPVKAGVLTATIVLAAAGIAAGVVVSDPTSSSGGGSTVASSSSPSTETTGTIPVAPPVVESGGVESVSSGAVLDGSSPDFAPESGGGVPKAKAGAEVAAAAAAATAAKAASDSTAAAGAQGGSEVKAGDVPIVAGPGAIKVARQFSNAFVLYETGRATPVVRETMRETATPDLVKALLERPPRLPANVKVPEAKVLNIVAGPRQGDTYTLSVSLLRVGVTSELRIDMKKTPVGKGSAGTGGQGSRVPSQWLVTDVLG